LVIDPEECLDCGDCALQCPVSAIVKDRKIPKDQRAFIQLNAELATIWPSISAKKVPPPDAEEWAGVPDKLKLLER
jgi:ferredoxin